MAKKRLNCGMRVRVVLVWADEDDEDEVDDDHWAMSSLCCAIANAYPLTCGVKRVENVGCGRGISGCMMKNVMG